MKKKQWAGLALAVVIFMLTGAASMIVSSSVKNTVNHFKSPRIFSRIGFSSENRSDVSMDKEYVEVINVEGTIQAAPTLDIMGNYSGYDHEFVMECIDSASKDGMNVGIVLKINSPGGTVYEADELYLKLMDYKKRTKRPVWVYMENEACSGGYYVAMAGDQVYANRNTWTGSIGVIMTTYNLKGFYDKLGIKEINIASGKNKAMGSMGQEMTAEQKEIMQGLVDNAYEQFVSIVAKGRGMDAGAVKKLADGRVYDAGQAKRLKLIDEVAGYEEFKKALKDKLGKKDISMYEPEQETDAFSNLMMKFRQLKPKSETELVTEKLEKNGGLMYYAKP